MSTLTKHWISAFLCSFFDLFSIEHFLTPVANLLFATYFNSYNWQMKPEKWHLGTVQPVSLYPKMWNYACTAHYQILFSVILDCTALIQKHRFPQLGNTAWNLLTVNANIALYSLMFCSQITLISLYKFPAPTHTFGEPPIQLQTEISL